MVTVAVRKRVYVHQAVMKTHRDLVGRVHLVINPRFHVVEKLAQRHRDLVVRDPDVAFADPEVTRPSPHVAEHAAMEVLDEFLAQQIAAARERPVLRAGNVVLLRFVQLAAVRDIRRDEPLLPNAEDRAQAGSELSAVWVGRARPSRIR